MQPRIDWPHWATWLKQSLQHGRSRNLRIRTANDAHDSENRRWAAGGSCTGSDGGSLLQGHSVCPTTGWRSQVARATCCCALVRRAKGGRIRAEFDARRRFRRHRSSAGGDLRGLPLSQRLDAGRQAAATSAGDGLDPWRRLRRRFGRRTALRRAQSRRKGHRRRHAQLPAQRAWLPRASRADRGIAGSRLRQLRHARPGRRAAMGEAQHRGVRRRSRQGHDRRRVGRLRSVSALMASPLANGLFHRAIGESGALFPTPSRRPDIARRCRARRRRIHAQGRSDVACRTPVDAGEADPRARRRGSASGPIVDGHFLPRSPADDICGRRPERCARCWPAGTRTRASISRCCRAPDAERSYPELVGAIFGERAEEALRHYPGGSKKRDRAGARALGGDLTIIHSTWAWLEAQRQTGRSAIFRFRFDRAPLTPEGWFGDRPSKDAGAFHAGEILYVFNNLDAFPWLVDRRRPAARRSRLGILGEFREDRRSERAGSSARGRPIVRPAIPSWCSTRRRRLRGDADRARHEFLADVVKGKAGKSSDIGSRTRCKVGLQSLAPRLTPPCPCLASKSPPRGRPAPCRRPSCSGARRG